MRSKVTGTPEEPRPSDGHSSGPGRITAIGSFEVAACHTDPGRVFHAIGGKNMNLKVLIGSGDRIGLFTLPFLLIGLVLNILHPSLFSVGGPSVVLEVLSIIILIPGVTVWIWSLVLILTKTRKQELITSGPYSLVKHPLYTGVSLLVLPWIGFLLDTWLGVLIGIVVYLGSRMFSPEEERTLSKTFGAAWDEYCNKVRIPWL
jgi:protein-S-isoprenylcysteine O-methyltransferase Ste14